MTRLSSLSPEQRELLDLLQQRSRAETSLPEPTAVVGIGCRFPGGVHDADSLWRLLSEGRDAVREVPPERWDVDAFYDPNPDAAGKMWTRSGGFLDNVDRFDAAFFGISPREANWMDPQQRLLLEVCWEALEDANIAPDSLSGSRTGVFGGLCTGDYFRTVYAHAERVSAYAATGTYASAAVGRISYVLGLQGPSIAVDTACSSSLVAVHLACQSLRQRECELALAGGVSLVLSPETSINLTKARMLSPDGRCKAFDAAADGYGRGEGCGVVVLKPLALAQQQGDAIWGVILGSSVNQDGRSNGLTAPNPVAQEELLRAALAAARLEAHAISYVEAHGTGTPLGDPIELGALAAVLGRNRPKERPLRVGTVKTNLGHLEVAAGVAGLIKTLVCMRRRSFVPNLHLRQLNPKIASAIGDVPIEICQCNEPWHAVDGRWLAGVSSFGFGGTNAHLIVEGTPEPPPSQQDMPSTGYSVASDEQVLCLSAKSPAALAALVRTYADFLLHTEAGAADICFTANTGRAHFEHRVAVVGTSCHELANKLAQIVVDRATSAGSQKGNGEAQQATLASTGDDTDPHSIAERYLQGCSIDWSAVYGTARRRSVSVPTYPFQRERYWIDSSMDLRGAPFREPPEVSQKCAGQHPLLGRRLRIASRDVIFESHLSSDSPDWVADHVVRGSVVVPGTAYVELALAAVRNQASGRAADPGHVTDRPLAISSVTLSQFLPLDTSGRLLQTVITPQADGGWQFACSSAEPTAGPDAAWTVHATGTTGPPPSNNGLAMWTIGQARSKCPHRRDALGYYQALASAGLEYGPAFQGISELWCGERAALAHVVVPPPIAAEVEKYTAHPAMLDACLQTFVAALDDAVDLYVPSGWENLEIFSPLAGDVWAFAQLDGVPEEEVSPAGDRSLQLAGQLMIFDSKGTVVVNWSGIRLQRLSATTRSEAGADVVAIAFPTQQARRFGENDGDELFAVIHDCAVRVLELPPKTTIAPDDDLFDLGMDSIMATDLLFSIENTLNRSISMEAMIKSRTLRQLVQYIRSHLAAST